MLKNIINMLLILILLFTFGIQTNYTDNIYLNILINFALFSIIGFLIEKPVYAYARSKISFNHKYFLLMFLPAILLGLPRILLLVFSFVTNENVIAYQLFHRCLSGFLELPYGSILGGIWFGIILAKSLVVSE